MRFFRNVFFTVLALAVIFLAWTYVSTYQPEELEAVEVACTEPVERYDETEPLSVMVYNVQYFAGKDYVFYYDLPDAKGPDRRPSPEAMATTLDGVADLIRQYDPDVLLLQEVDEGSAATGQKNQTQQLLDRLPEGAFPCRAETFYWKADFVPHPDIMGSVGRKLTTLSRFTLDDAERHRLPGADMNPIMAQFYLKRAVLKAGMVSEQGNRVDLLNTHLAAFAQGTDTMERQVATLSGLLEQLDRDNRPWILGGDFNLLPPGQLSSLQRSQQSYYREPTELAVLLNKWSSVPSLENIAEDPKAWSTHFPNDPRVTEPDRTIDYVFYSDQFQLLDSEVVQIEQARELSDHLPIRAEFAF